MVVILEQFKQILITAMCMLVIVPVFAQVKHADPPPKHRPPSEQLKDFLHLTEQANATFVYPKGFREVQATDDEDFSFDYALELPGKGFEIWLQAKSLKEEWF